MKLRFDHAPRIAWVADQFAVLIGGHFAGVALEQIDPIAARVVGDMLCNMVDSPLAYAKCADPFCRFVCLERLLQAVRPEHIFPIDGGWVAMRGGVAMRGTTLTDALLQHVMASDLSDILPSSKIDTCANMVQMPYS